MYLCHVVNVHNEEGTSYELHHLEAPRPPPGRDGGRVYCVANRNEPAAADFRHYTSVGRLSAVFPCGIKSSTRTMFWHESHDQMFAMLVDVMRVRGQIRHIRYDDACHLAPFLHNRFSASTDRCARFQASDMDFFIDRFHFKGHTDPHRRARYDPDDREILRDLNTSAVEANADTFLLRMSLLRNVVARECCVKVRFAYTR